MQRQIRENALELAIAIVGLAAAVIEAVFADKDTAVMVAVTALLIAVAAASIRADVARKIDEAFVDQQIIQEIPDRRWQADALGELAGLRVALARWRDGTRALPRESSLNYQIAALANARTSVCAVHRVDDDESIRRWLSEEKGFARLAHAFRNLPRGVERRRVLIVEQGSPLVSSGGTDSTTPSPQLDELCGMQTRPVDHGGLGFDVRLFWVKPGTRPVADTLIIDGRESCSIEKTGHGEFGDLEVCVNPAQLRDRVRAFEDLWTEATSWQASSP
jgi:hypothetical protein